MRQQKINNGDYREENEKRETVEYHAAVCSESLAFSVWEVSGGVKIGSESRCA